jgi:hypothetical protein
MAREPAVLSRFPPSDRPRTRIRGLVARDWPRPLGPHTRSGHRSDDRRNDHGRAAILRSGPLPRRTLPLACGRKFPKVVAIPDIGVEECPFRECRLEGSRYLAGYIDVLIDSAGDESHRQTLALVIIFDIGNRAGRHIGQRRGCPSVRPASS